MQEQINQLQERIRQARSAGTALRIRGAEADHTVVIIDGVKLNDPSSTGGGYNSANLLTGDELQIEFHAGGTLMPGAEALVAASVRLPCAVVSNKDRVHEPKFGDRARDLGDLGVRVGSSVSGMGDQPVERPLLDLGGKVRLHGAFGF